MNDLSRVDTVLKIERACFEKPWSKTAVVLSLENDFMINFVEEWGYIIGTRLYGGDTELYRIGVLPEFRGKGRASELMRRFLEKRRGDVFLEVEESNFPAIALYKKFGFKEISRRKDYYGAGKHALTMKLNGASNEHN